MKTHWAYSKLWHIDILFITFITILGPRQHRSLKKTLKVNRGIINCNHSESCRVPCQTKHHSHSDLEISSEFHSLGTILIKRLTWCIVFPYMEEAYRLSRTLWGFSSCHKSHQLCVSIIMCKTKYSIYLSWALCLSKLLSFQGISCQGVNLKLVSICYLQL